VASVLHRLHRFAQVLRDPERVGAWLVRTVYTPEEVRTTCASVAPPMAIPFGRIGSSEPPCLSRN
jgi:hypothetical protein